MRNTFHSQDLRILYLSAGDLWSLETLMISCNLTSPIGVCPNMTLSRRWLFWLHPNHEKKDYQTKSSVNLKRRLYENYVSLVSSKWAVGSRGGNRYVEGRRFPGFLVYWFQKFSLWKFLDFMPSEFQSVQDLPYFHFMSSGRYWSHIPDFQKFSNGSSWFVGGRLFRNFQFSGIYTNSPAPFRGHLSCGIRLHCLFIS